MDMVNGKITFQLLGNMFFAKVDEAAFFWEKKFLNKIQVLVFFKKFSHTQIFSLNLTHGKLTLYP